VGFSQDQTVSRPKSCSPVLGLSECASMTRGLSFILLFMVAFTAFAASDWQTLDCRYKPNQYNDGDSFHCDCAGTNFIFRLYFVDAPETDEETSYLEDRVSEQAKYFGISTDAALKIGKSAATFTEATLKDKPLRITTRFAKAGGRSRQGRDYAFVEVDQKDLAELLIANGLARIHGVDADKPGERKAATEQQYLKQLEVEAKKAKRGAWGAN
jgi:endonuclease YncB( thermonuclease family)